MTSKKLIALLLVVLLLSFTATAFIGCGGGELDEEQLEELNGETEEDLDDPFSPDGDPGGQDPF